MTPLALCFLAAAAAPDPATVVARVQSFYEKTQDFTAAFEQTYTYKVFGRAQKSSGRVYVKKPGRMRWEYEKPAPKRFVLDGKKLWIHDPEENQVIVNDQFAADKLSSSVTFLWGKGRLAEEFVVATADRADLQGAVIQLAPKKPQPGFTTIYFGADPATGEVRETIVVDAQGNENRMRFSALKTNVGMSDKDFVFEIPKGATVVDAAKALPK